MELSGGRQFSYPHPSLSPSIPVASFPYCTPTPSTHSFDPPTLPSSAGRGEDNSSSEAEEPKAEPRGPAWTTRKASPPSWPRRRPRPLVSPRGCRRCALTLAEFLRVELRSWLLDLAGDEAPVVTHSVTELPRLFTASLIVGSWDDAATGMVAPSPRRLGRRGSAAMPVIAPSNACSGGCRCLWPICGCCRRGQCDGGVAGGSWRWGARETARWRRESQGRVGGRMGLTDGLVSRTVEEATGRERERERGTLNERESTKTIFSYPSRTKEF